MKHKSKTQKKDRLNSQGKSARVDLGIGDNAKLAKYKRSSLASLKMESNVLPSLLGKRK